MSEMIVRSLLATLGIDQDDIPDLVEKVADNLAERISQKMKAHCPECGRELETEPDADTQSEPQ